MRPGEDVGTMIRPVVAGHEGDLCPRGFQAKVPHDVTVSVWPLALANGQGTPWTIAPSDAFLLLSPDS